MKSNAIQNTGDAAAIDAWYENIKEGGLFNIPPGRPAFHPFYYRDDGVIVLHDPQTGEPYDVVPVGDWVLFSLGGFMSAHYDEPETPPTQHDQDGIAILSQEGGIAILSTQLKQRHPYYLLNEHTDGTLVLRPAVVRPATYEPDQEPRHTP